MLQFLVTAANIVGGEGGRRDLYEMIYTNFKSFLLKMFCLLLHRPNTTVDWRHLSDENVLYR
jgi:hypothetical protein